MRQIYFRKLKIYTQLSSEFAKKKRFQMAVRFNKLVSYYCQKLLKLLKNDTI